MFSFSSKVYAITDRRLSGLSITEQVSQLIAGGARLIQIRDKELSAAELFREAEASINLAQESGAQIIINDRADLAYALKAHGVHLGQEDLPPQAARQLLGPDAIVGFSTHTLEQVHAARSQPVSYIAFGPVFPTMTKKNPDPVVGVDAIRRVKEIVGDKPLVAIGGITAANAPSVISAGADAVAMIAALCGRETTISRNTSQIIQLLTPVDRV
jgi:thiamine-phosphate pyrophosphorylase